VTPGSEAARIGVVPGSIVSTIDESIVGRAGERDFAVAVGEMKGDVPDPVRSLLSASSLLTIETGETRVGLDLRYGPYRFYWSIVPFLLGILVLVGGAWWMKGGRAGAGLRGLAIPLACASAVPLLAAPLATWGALLGTAAAVMAPALASLLLADAIAALIEAQRRRLAVLGLALVAGTLAALLPLLYLLTATFWSDASAAAWWALLLVSLVPMLVVTLSRPLPGTPLAGADNPGPLWLIAAACTPAVAMLTHTAGDMEWAAWYVVPFWITVLVVGRAVGRRIARTRLRRDLVVTVTEAERARLAAELHDVALQELTLLVRRLDASGDATSAAMARTVSDHLRELCGELHLPILDELGAGSALEWLVQQVTTATGEEIRLERSDAARPPAGVELAVFRVAQEAISNAVKHGGAPIVVRYATSASMATLAVDDAGPGLDVGRDTIAPRPGHYGLASMQQRAELIGALLSIRAWPGGGTRVSLEWKAS